MKKQKIKSAREIKVETVQTLSEKIARAKTLAFANYHGLTVNQISQLREKVKEAGGELIVTKNSLMKRALGQKILPVENQLTGPTATVFSYEDEIAPIKAVAESAKVTGLPSFKFGLFGRDFMDSVALETLAKIPSLPELHAQVVGAISSPLYGLVSVLQANIRNLVSVIDQASKRG